MYQRFVSAGLSCRQKRPLPLGIVHMEGPLSKWTNVVQGWQYRWFVLTDDAVIYYTSRDKMLKRAQRGCMRLRGAIVGIDGENESLFTLTQDGKIFHLQGRDEKERNEWVRALDTAIRECSGYPAPGAGTGAPVSTGKKQKNREANEALKEKIVEADGHMAALTESVKSLEAAKSHASETEKASLDDIVKSGNKLLDAVKHAVILLQMARNQVDHVSFPVDVAHQQQHGGEGAESADTESADSADGERTRHVGPSKLHPFSSPIVNVPPISYSSSDDEFYDAQEDDDKEDSRTLDGRRDSLPTPLGSQPGGSESVDELDRYDFGDDHEDFDTIYDNAEEHDVGNLQQEHGSVLVHLLSQVSVGMDLTKVTLPTFILERRSLLEMYADFFAHPDAFVSTTGLESPEQRFIAVVRYYLNAFYAARKSGVAKKPYNPILGETFRCRYRVPNLPDSGNRTQDGPFPGSDDNHLTFIAEQVSHHPPVSAFYAEHPGKKVSFHAHIWTKSSFLGLSIGVANLGSGTVILHEFDEEYTVTFPSGYGRSIMSTPWVELGGKVKITCEKTGYYAEVDFLTKPFFGGKPHRIQGNCFREGFKKPILTIRGEWNGIMFAKPLNGEEYVFIDVKQEPEVKKECVPVMQQGERESRRLWRHVTAGLLRNRINVATTAKRMIEERQRKEAKERQEKGEAWTSRLFEKAGDDRWVFKNSLDKREPI